jgi:hypothetical protein
LLRARRTFTQRRATAACGRVPHIARIFFFSFLPESTRRFDEPVACAPQLDHTRSRFLRIREYIDETQDEPTANSAYLSMT